MAEQPGGNVGGNEIRGPGAKAGDLIKKAIADAIAESAQAVAAEGARRAPKNTGTLGRSITTDPKVGAREMPSTPGAGSAAGVGGGSAASGRYSSSFVAYAHTGPESKHYAWVQHEGVIRPKGEPIVVKSYTTKTGRHVGSHMRSTPIQLTARHGGGPKYLSTAAEMERPKIARRVRDAVKARFVEGHIT